MSPNFVCAIEDNARRFAAKPAVICAGNQLSWSDLDAYASGFAQHLSSQNITAGDRVAILLPNGLEFVIAFLAILIIRPRGLFPRMAD